MEADDQPVNFDSLPTELQAESLRQAHWSARTTSKAFRRHIEAGCPSLQLRWPTDPNAASLNRLQRMLGRLPQLRGLGSAGCPACHLPLVAMPAQTALSLQDSPDIALLAPLSACQRLADLNLAGCTRLADLRALAVCPLLQSVDLTGCIAVEDFRPLGACPLLSTLRMGKQPWWRRQLPSLSACLSLTLLDVGNPGGGSDRLDDIGTLAACPSLPSLRTLSLYGCMRLTDIAPLSACLALQSLDLDACRLLVDISPLAACTALTSLSFGGSGSLELHDIGPLAACCRLEELTFCNCPALADLRPLAACTALTSLSCNYCDRIVDLSPLTACTRLRKLDLMRCRGAKDVRPLAACKSLQVLRARSWDDYLKVVTAAVPGLTVITH